MARAGLNRRPFQSHLPIRQNDLESAEKMEARSGARAIGLCSIYAQWQRNLDNRTAFYAITDCEPAISAWLQSGNAFRGN